VRRSEAPHCWQMSRIHKGAGGKESCRAGARPGSLGGCPYVAFRHFAATNPFARLNSGRSEFDPAHTFTSSA